MKTWQDLLRRFARPAIADSIIPAPSEVPLDRLKREAEEARLLLESDAYVAAYQRALDRLVEGIIACDITTEEGRTKALNYAAQIQQHQRIASDLASAVSRYEYEAKRRQPRAA